MAQMLLSHVRSCKDESCQTCHRLRERIISRAASSSHGGPREPTSWRSRWLPVVPLFSEETGGQQRPEHAGVTRTDSAVAPMAPTPSAAECATECGQHGLVCSCLVANDVPGQFSAALWHASLALAAPIASAPTPAHAVPEAAVMAEEMVAEMMVELIPVERVAPAAVRVVVAWALRGEAEVATVAAATVAETAAVEREGGANSSGARDATAAALEERWADHWKAKQARATGPAPGTAAAPAALNYNASWPFAPSAPSAPSAPACLLPQPGGTHKCAHPVGKWY